MHDERLKRGITGFWHVNETPPPHLSRKSISSAAHPAARATGWTVNATHWAQHANYHQFDIAKQATRRSILFNAAHPVIAFASVAVGDGSKITFVDGGELARAFFDTGIFVPLAKDVLDAPLNSDDLKHLSTAERTQVMYWKPETIGELVFNHWD